MNAIENNARYLAVHPTTYGFGFAVFEGPLRLIDWGAHRTDRDKNERGLLFLSRLLKRYEPRVVLFEGRTPRERQRSERIRLFLRSTTMQIRNRGTVVERIPRRRVRGFFEIHGAKTQQEIATRIVELLPELSHYLPPVRKTWMPEHPRMGMFEAIALALTYFLSEER